MPDSKLLCILRITCDVIDEPCGRWKFNSQIIGISSSPSYRGNKALWTETDKVGMHDGKINMSDYLRCGANKAADARASINKQNS